MSTYDGNRITRWEFCPFQPTHIRNQITLRKIEQLNNMAMALMHYPQSLMNQPPKTFEGRPITEEQRIQLRDRGYNV